MANAEVSNFGGILNFSQEVAIWRQRSLPRDNNNELQDILRNSDDYFSHQLPCTRFELAFSKTAGLKAIIYYHQLVQTAKTVINYQDEFEHVQTT